MLNPLTQGGGNGNTNALSRNATGATGDGTKWVWYDTLTELTWQSAPPALGNNSLGRYQWGAGYPVCDRCYIQSTSYRVCQLYWRLRLQRGNLNFTDKWTKRKALKYVFAFL